MLDGESVMISLEDCVAFSGLSEDEVAALSLRKHP